MTESVNGDGLSLRQWIARAKYIDPAVMSPGTADDVEWLRGAVVRAWEENEEPHEFRAGLGPVGGP